MNFAIFSATATCKICDNKQDNTPYRVKEMMYGTREAFDYFECNECKCLQIASFPEDTSKYYPSDYYSFKPNNKSLFRGLSGLFRKTQYTKSLFGGSFHKATLGKLIDKKFFYLFQNLGLSRQSRILDIGCGDGKNFLYPLKEMGFENLLGCDPFLSESIYYKNGLSILKSNVQDVDGEWDLITYHHSFEHVPDPLEHLNQVESLLAENGTCILRIPTVSSYAWKHYGVHWSQLDAPRHFFLYSKKSIELLAEKAHLRLEKVVYDSGHFQFTGSELYKQDIPLNQSRKKGVDKFLSRKLKKYSYQAKAKRLNKENQGDQAAFYLVKA